MVSTEGVAAKPRCAVQPFFLDTPRGPMFAVHRQPADAAALRGHVLVVPGFNEEMNRCRSMLTLLAEHLAAIGFGALVIDLHGTGDSAGAYVDGRWDAWREDIALARASLDARPGACVGYLGVRLGAMLAADALRDAPARVDKLILWQPVVDGKQHLTQFLRVRIAAQMDRPDLPKESTAGMRARWAAGEPVEVGGYEIHPELARAIDAARLGALVPRTGTRVLWLEQPAPGATELSPPSAAALKAWQDAGVAARWQSFDGPAFWQQYERVLAPAAIAATVAWLRADGAAA
jgi:exosortase A-associated hydrolase 2